MLAAPANGPSFLSQQVTSARRFYLNLRPRATKAITVVCGGWEECRSDYVIDRKTFPHLAVEFVAAGSGVLRLDGALHPLTPGTIFSYGPGVPHEIRTSPEEPLGKYFVDATGSDTRQLMNNIGLAPGNVLHTGAIADVREAFAALIRLGVTRDQRTERMCALQLELLLHTIGRSKQITPLLERRAHATFERCRRHIDEHYLSLRSLDDVSVACHVKGSHLCKLFRRFHDESPLRYLQRLRMSWAAERLDCSSALVQDVADELGLDPFQFSRTFKRVHGVAPSVFLRGRN